MAYPYELVLSANMNLAKIHKNKKNNEFSILAVYSGLFISVSILIYIYGVINSVYHFQRFQINETGIIIYPRLLTMMT